MRFGFQITTWSSLWMLQVAVLAASSLATLGLTAWLHRCDSAGYFTKLAALVELAGKADATGLRAVPINPVSSSPKALARYRDLAVLAIEARESRA